MRTNKISLNRFRYKNIVIPMFYSNLKKPSKAIILCYGLPDTPLHKSELAVTMLVNRGFFVFSPHYEGTHDSFGKSTIENSVKSILQTIDFVRKGKGKSLWSLNTSNWKTKEIILAGGSFGGSVALVAGAKSKHVKNIVDIAAPVDYWIQGKKYRDESIMEDYYRVRRGWINTWRVTDKKIWQRFHNGKLDVNPVDYADILKDKNVFIAHGTADKSVDIRQSVFLFNKLKAGNGKHKFLKLRGYQHLGIRGLQDKKVFNSMMRWLG